MPSLQLGQTRGMIVNRQQTILHGQRLALHGLLGLFHRRLGGKILGAQIARTQ